MLVDIQLSTPGAHNEQRGVEPSKFMGARPNRAQKMGQQGPRMGEFNFGAQRETGDMLR